MYKKSKCKKCKYHVRSAGGIACYYAGVKSISCLYREGEEVKDRRGGDPNNCLLYENSDNKRQLIL